MRLFALSDLHLSFGNKAKSMEVFHGWENYTEKIEKNWKLIVSSEDIVVLAGDISWAIGLERAKIDFDFINRLPGEKILIKGNHDFWWSTMSRMSSFLTENSFDSIKILHNNCIAVGNHGICGTRGWLYDGVSVQDTKIIAREAGRLEASLSTATAHGLEPLVFLHYPPAYGDYVCNEITDVLHKYSVTKVWYGHIHGAGRFQALSEYQGIKLQLISCDSVQFTPVLIA